MGWTVRGSNPGGGKIFHTCTDQLWGPPSLLYNGYQVSFPGITLSGAQVKERVELHLEPFRLISRHPVTVPVSLPLSFHSGHVVPSLLVAPG